MTTAARCVHHWRIERPQGEFSEGICLNCGATREFRNSAPDETTMYSKQNGGKNKLTPGQAAFGHPWRVWRGGSDEPAFREVHS